MKDSMKEYLVSKIVGDMPIMMNMHINVKGIKKGWVAYGANSKYKDECVITPMAPRAERED